MPLFYYRVRDIISPMSRSNRGCGMIARYLQFLPLHSPRSPGDLTRPQSGHPLMKLLLETEGVSETDSEGVSESETSEDPIVVEVGTYFDIGPNFYDAVFLPQLNATRIPARRVSTSSPLPAGIIQGSSSVSPVGDGGKCDVVRGIPAGYHAVGACAVAEFGIPLFVVRLVSARPERGVATGEAVCGVVVIGEESGGVIDIIDIIDIIGEIGAECVGSESGSETGAASIDIGVIIIIIITIIIITLIITIIIITLIITNITLIIPITPPRIQSLACQRQPSYSLRSVSLFLLSLPRTFSPRLFSRSNTRPPNRSLPSNTEFPSTPPSNDSSPYPPAGIIISSPTPRFPSTTESPSRQPTPM